MKVLRIITPIIICVLLTASSLKAEEKEVSGNAIPKSIEAILYQGFLPIKAIDMSSYMSIFSKVIVNSTRVVFVDDTAEKIGLDKNELTNYLKLRIKNNFTGIKLETVYSDALKKYDDSEIGRIHVSVWVVGAEYPIAYLIEYYFFDRDLNEIWTQKMMGCGSIDAVKNGVKAGIDDLTQDLAISFFKARGEL